MKFLYTGMLGFLLLFGFYNGRKQLAKSNNIKSECSKLVDFLNTNYKDSPVVLSPGVTSEKAALMFAYFYSSEKSRPELKKYIVQRFPELLWYDVFNEKLISFSEVLKSDKYFLENKSILFQTTDENYSKDFLINYEKLSDKKNLKLTEIFSNENGELIYKIE
jgi:hypothetical protein